MIVTGEAPHRLVLGFLGREDVSLAGDCVADILSLH